MTSIATRQDFNAALAGLVLHPGVVWAQFARALPLAELLHHPRALRAKGPMLNLQNLGDSAYQLNWATNQTFAATCRRLRLDLGEQNPDGTPSTAPPISASPGNQESGSIDIDATGCHLEPMAGISPPERNYK